ncbi:putative glutathione S-transferase, N-terminal domain [Lyophyllum shimeji]|uniref:Glutathione S-transferase, N-terminal domain n=1 Tax=Lyophyllum shimeji TaxID=47721 RepID=A0A9P3PXT9_LYOSH|nr:putative glutathione S-transferase, N-terminal domain [Lyophyllum shimeji]
MSNVISFYDIPSKTGKPWSGNTWKARYALNYKGIPYKTVWVEYPDIEAAAKQIGAAPTGKRPDGTPLYTCPMIHDPSTNTAVSESLAIAEYLDRQYPDTPRLLPPGTTALQHAFMTVFQPLGGPALQFALPATHRYLTPASEGYFRFHREKAFGKIMETWTPTGPERDVEWAKVKASFNTLDGWLQAGKADGPFFGGKIPCFSDFAVGARLIWYKLIFGEDGEKWKDILTWNEGRWAAYTESLKPYEAVL